MGVRFVEFRIVRTIDFIFRRWEFSRCWMKNLVFPRRTTNRWFKNFTAIAKVIRDTFGHGATRQRLEFIITLEKWENKTFPLLKKRLFFLFVSGRLRCARLFGEKSRQFERESNRMYGEEWNRIDQFFVQQRRWNVGHVEFVSVRNDVKFRFSVKTFFRWFQFAESFDLSVASSKIVRNWTFKRKF